MPAISQSGPKSLAKMRDCPVGSTSFTSGVMAAFTWQQGRYRGQQSIKHTFHSLLLGEAPSSVTCSRLWVFYPSPLYERYRLKGRVIACVIKNHVFLLKVTHYILECLLSRGVGYVTALQGKYIGRWSPSRHSRTDMSSHLQRNFINQHPNTFFYFPIWPISGFRRNISINE